MGRSARSGAVVAAGRGGVVVPASGNGGAAVAAATGDARNGRLAFLDPSFTIELGALVLEGLRLHGMTPLPFSTNERIERHRAYVDVDRAYFAPVTFLP